MNCLRESHTTVGKGYCGLIIERNNNAVHATAIINVMAEPIGPLCTEAEFMKV
jgi:hypothetical protein